MGKAIFYGGGCGVNGPVRERLWRKRSVSIGERQAQTLTKGKRACCGQSCRDPLRG